MPPLKTGDTAPDFTLDSTSGDKITLSQVLEQGPAVLVFYRFDFGPI